MVSLVATVLMATLLAACGGQTAPKAGGTNAAALPKPEAKEADMLTGPAKTKVTLGIGGIGSFTWLVTYVADGAGFLKEAAKAAGVEIEVVSFKNGNDASTALVAGQVDMTANYANHSVKAQAGGKNLLTVANLFEAGGVVIVAKRDAKDVATVADLNGKAVGFTSFGSGSHMAAVSAVKSAGLDPAFVIWTPYGSQAAAIAAFGSGRLDAAAMTEPNVTIALRDNQIKVLLDLYDREKSRAVYGAPYAGSSLLTTRAFADANGKTVRALIEAHLKAMKFIADNLDKPEEITKRLPSDFDNLKGQPYMGEVIRRVASSFSTDALLTVETMKSVLAEQEIVQGKKISIKLEDTFDNRYNPNYWKK